MSHRSWTRRLRVALVSCAFATAAVGQEPPAGFDATDPAAAEALFDSLRVRHGAPAGGGGGLNNLLTVSSKGGKFKTISSALASITNASSTNRYQIQVGPGEYVEHVVMKPFVDLVGSGRGTTRIKATGGTTIDTAAVVRAADTSIIRALTISHTGGGPYAVGIYAATTASVYLYDVSLVVSGGTTENYGIFSHAFTLLELSDVNASGNAATGIFVPGANALVALYRSSTNSSGANNAALTKSGAGVVYLYDAAVAAQSGVGLGLVGGPSAAVYGSRISGATALRCAGCSAQLYFTQVQGSGGPGGVSRGVEVSTGIVQVVHGALHGSGATIFAGPGTQVQVAHAMLSGGAAGGGGVLKCAAITDESFAFHASTCP